MLFKDLTYRMNANEHWNWPNILINVAKVGWTRSEAVVSLRRFSKRLWLWLCVCVQVQQQPLQGQQLSNTQDYDFQVSIQSNTS